MLALPTRRATIRLAHAIASVIAPGDLIVLTGGLGAHSCQTKWQVARGVRPDVADREYLALVKNVSRLRLT